MAVAALQHARRLWLGLQRRAPAWAEASWLPPLFQLKDGARLLVRPRLPTCEYFPADGGGTPKAVGIGLSAMARIDEVLLGCWPEKRASAPAPFWRVGSTGRAHAAEVVAAEGPLRMISRLPRHNALVLPRCVSHTLDVTGTWPEVCDRFHKSIKTNELRWIRKHGYRFERSTSREDFEHFYETMYRPFVIARHGAAASLTSQAKSRELFTHGFLLRVFLDGAWVAGALCELRTAGLRLCEIGVLESDRTLIKEGAIAAAYVAALQTANALGCRYINMTISASLLSNGTFQYKRRWGGEISLPPSEQKLIWIHFARHTPQTHQLLSDTPMITWDRDGSLHGVVGVESLDQWTEAEASHCRAKYWTPGLSSFRVIPLDHFRKTGVLTCVPVEGARPSA